MTRQAPAQIKLGAAHQRWVYATGALLLASGLLWLLFHFFLRMQGEYGERPHPLEYGWLRLHGAAAMLSLLVLGSVLPVHVRRAWQRRKNRLTGVAFAGVLLLLVVTGYALYYFSDSVSRGWIGGLHWAVGLATPALLWWHVRSAAHLPRADAPARGGARRRLRAAAAAPEQQTPTVH